VKDRRVKAILHRDRDSRSGAVLRRWDGHPAISVISSVEGLEVALPGVTCLVVPITVALITLLFTAQRFGTHAIGRLFGPMMALWFALLAVTGLAKVAQRPAILKSLSPTYGISFFATHQGVGFLSLRAVVLVVPAPRRSTPISVTSTGRRSDARGSSSSSQLCSSTTSGRAP
jgi:hypothetical protein